MNEKKTHDCNDKLADAHARGTNEKEASTAHSIDQLNTNNSHCSVYNVADYAKGIFEPSTLLIVG